MPKISRYYLSLLVSALLLASCGNIPVTADNETIAVGIACQSSNECLTGYSCYVNVCRNICNEDNDCDVENYHCEDSVCLPGKATICGNGILEVGEDCDDGDRLTGDGCDTNCNLELGWRCLNQAPEMPNSVCNRTQGYCLGNFTGDNCDQCADHFTGDNCDQCADRFTGNNCDQCADSRFTGANCDHCKVVGQNQMTDSECNVYNTVVIDNKTWMKENLRNSSVPHYSADGNSDNDLTYGYLYTWENANKACPAGWRLPTCRELNELRGISSCQEGTVSTTNIQDPSWFSSATNSTGFSALPAGKHSVNGIFYSFGSVAFFWSATRSGRPANNIYYFLQIGMEGDLDAAMVADFGNSNTAFSVRCVKNTCDDGYIEPYCKKITCVHGKVNKEDGKCIANTCSGNFTGENCDQCKGSFTGENCDQCLVTGENQMADSECNIYKTVIINDQTWMAENLRNSSVDHYSADNKSSNDATYGYLYTWENAIKACPEGWRLPTKIELNSLVTTSEAGNDSSSIRDSSWASGSNSSGFSALPAGYRNGSGNFANFGFLADFWSSTPGGSHGAYLLSVGSSRANVDDGDVDVAFSVRCLKNSN